jgi:5'-methylthioadenosine phosphorylase
MVTDYDCWHPEHDNVEVASLIAVLNDNAARARRLVREVSKLLGGRTEICRQGCDRALEAALITPPETRDPALAAKLGAVAGRVLG